MLFYICSYLIRITIVPRGSAWQTTSPVSRSFGRVASAIFRAYNLRKHRRWLDASRKRTSSKTVPATKKETGRIELISWLDWDFTKWWLSISIFDQQLITEERLAGVASQRKRTGHAADRRTDSNRRFRMLHQIENCTVMFPCCTTIRSWK